MNTHAKDPFLLPFIACSFARDDRHDRLDESFRHVDPDEQQLSARQLGF